MSGEVFVPEDLAVLDGLIAGEFRLAPLGPQHNEAYYAAWTASVDPIRATPGFPDGSWPREMSLSDNLRDLERHAQDFTERRGFTYTVLSTGTGDVIGCVYIYPVRGREPSGGAEGRRHASVQVPAGSSASVLFIERLLVPRPRVAEMLANARRVEVARQSRSVRERRDPALEPGYNVGHGNGRWRSGTPMAACLPAGLSQCSSVGKSGGVVCSRSTARANSQAPACKQHWLGRRLHDDH
jgi:hypothetical protein